jgi:hypothetical protein
MPASHPRLAAALGGVSVRPVSAARGNKFKANATKMQALWKSRAYWPMWDHRTLNR